MSIKDITQERAWIKNDIFSVEDTAVVETKDVDHANELYKALKEKYGEVRFTGNIGDLGKISIMQFFQEVCLKHDKHWFVIDVEESDDEQDDDSGIMNGNGLGVPNRKRELSSRRGSVRIIVEEWRLKAYSAMSNLVKDDLWRTNNNHIWNNQYVQNIWIWILLNMECNFFWMDITNNFEYNVSEQKYNVKKHLC